MTRWLRRSCAILVMLLTLTPWLAEAAEAGIAFARTPMPNADPAFCDVLAAVVREHVAGVPA